MLTGNLRSPQLLNLTSVLAPVIRSPTLPYMSLLRRDWHVPSIQAILTLLTPSPESHVGLMGTGIVADWCKSSDPVCIVSAPSPAEASSPRSH